MILLAVLLAGLQYVGTSVETGQPVWMPTFTPEQQAPEWDRLIRRREGEALLALRAAEQARLEAATVEPPPPATTTTTAHPTSGIVWRPQVERWRGLVDRYFTGVGETEHALAIIRCESVGDPDAVNPSSGTAGLFQHRPELWAARSAAAGIPGADIFDPASNIEVAAWLAHEDGWQHWSGKAWGVQGCEEWACQQGVC
jgi:hypothetical protein